MDIQYNRMENYRTVVRTSTTQLSTIDENSNSAAQNGGGETTNSGGTEEQQQQQQQPQQQLSLNDDRHVENTVIFVPNVWTLMPTSAEYEQIVEAYKNFIDNPPPPPTTTTAAAKSTNESTVEVKPNGVGITNVKSGQNETSGEAKSKSTEVKTDQIQAKTENDEPMTTSHDLKSIKALTLTLFLFFRL